MSSLRFLNLRTVLDISHTSSSQDSRIVKLQKEKFRICKVWPIERQARPIENRVLQNLNRAQSSQKRLGFEFNTTRYKRKTLNMFQKFSKFLWVTLVKFERFYNLLTQQALVTTNNLVIFYPQHFYNIFTIIFFFFWETKWN